MQLSDSLDFYSHLISQVKQEIDSKLGQWDWPNIDIIDRIRTLYSTRIRSFKYRLGQNLFQSKFTLARFTPSVVSLILLLTDDGQQTLADFFEDAEGLGVERENEKISIPDDAAEDTENEVLERIELNDWEITPPHDDVPIDTEFGILAGRYSSDAQNDTGCVARVKKMLDMAEENEIPLYRKPIVEIAESGKSINREGLREVVRLVQHPQVKYLFVHNINRLARWNSFCIFLIELLTREFDVDIYTSKGELDLTRIKGLATTWVMSMSGEIENRTKAKLTLDGQMENFEEGSDGVWYRGDWIGYSSSEDDLKQVEDKEVEVAKTMFETFDQAPEYKPYAETLEVLNSEYEDILEDALGDDDDSDNEDDDYILKYDRLKVMLQDPIYIGKPIAEGESIGDQGQQKQLDRPNLKIIDEELFDRVNEKIERVSEQNSDTTSSGEIMNLDYLLHEFGLLPVVESSPQVAVLCPDCEIPMVRDKHYSLKNEERRVPVYVCPKCKQEVEEARENDDIDREEEEISGNYKTFPNSLELYKIRLFDEAMDNLAEVSRFLDSDFN